jgi:hypothetical protein
VDQEKEMLKKLVDLKIQLAEKKITISKITDQDYDIDDCWKISKLFSNNWNSNTAK